MNRSPWLNDLPNEAIASLDPLAFDHFFERLPRFNADKQVNVLVRVAQEANDKADQHVPSNDVEAYALMRDLGFLVGALHRHGVSVADKCPALLADMIELGRRTDMVPRDTVLHYTVWNPTGQRQRTFTGDKEESRLITVTGEAIGHMEDAIRSLAKAGQTEPTQPDFASLCTDAADALQRSAHSVSLPGAGIDPVHFGTVLRFYFEPMTIDGVAFDAPAAAQAPLYIVDELVRGSDYDDSPQTTALRHDLAKYGLPRWRQTFQSASSDPSLKTLIETAHLNPFCRSSQQVQKSAAALALVLRALTVFRGRHRRVVKAAYSESIRSYSVGSAGADVDVLDKILGSTRACAHAVQNMTRPTSTGCPVTAA